MTSKQRRAIDRAPPERRPALAEAFERANTRDRALSVRLGLAVHGVDVGDALADLTANYRGRI